MIITLFILVFLIGLVLAYYAMIIALFILVFLIGLGLAYYEHRRIMRSYKESEEITDRILSRINKKDQLD